MIFHIELRSYRIVGWVCLVFSTICIIAAFLSGEHKVAIGFSAFAILGIYVILGAGSFDIDGDSLTHKSFFGKWKILWSEISSVEVGENDGTLVFHGSNKRFILSPPGWWYGSDKNKALDGYQTI